MKVANLELIVQGMSWDVSGKTQKYNRIGPWIVKRSFIIIPWLNQESSSHWAIGGILATSLRDILKGLVRYPGGFPKLLHPKWIMKKPLMGGGVGGWQVRGVVTWKQYWCLSKAFCKMPSEDYGVMLSLWSRVHLVKSKNMFQFQIW